MSAQLERLGCDVDAVATGSDAIRQVSQRRYALVLTDLALPDMSGLDVAVAIRQLGSDAARVPIVAVTGGIHPRDRERCLAAGMNDYLTKPVARDDLRKVVERFVPRDGAPPAWTATAVESMAADFGAERMQDLLAGFARELAQRLDRLVVGTSAQAIGREAHALKSAALVFGAESLGKAAQTLEQNCRNATSADLQQETTNVVALGREVYAAVQSWLANRTEHPS
jgi:CheY-like chemotaxis protein